jgi:hypothetical protein
MKNKNECIPIHWYQSECDEQPTGVLVQMSDGETQYLTIKEYNEFMNNADHIINAAYRNYLNTYSGNYELDREEFINASKTAPDFSEKWGLKIEERELSEHERWILYCETCIKLNTPSIKGSTNKEQMNEYHREYNIPTKLITITYNNETIESYE